MAHLSYLGNFSPGVATTESYVAQALEYHGHTVDRIQENTFDYRQTRARLKHGAAQILFWTRTPSYRVNAGTQTQMLVDAAKLGVTTVGLHLDKYWDLARQSDIMEHPFFRQDVVYTADGGNQDRFEAAGVNHRWWRPAVPLSQCGPGVFNPQYACPVAFVGSDRYHPEWPWRRTLIRFLAQTYRSRFHQYGRSGDRLNDDQLADAYASVDVVVGDSCLVGGRGRYYCVDDQTEILTKRGWLTYDDVTTADQAWTINPDTQLGEWQNIEAVTVHPSERRTMWSMEGQRHSSLTTMNHRWFIERHATERIKWGPSGPCPECGWESPAANRQWGLAIHRAHLHGVRAGEPIKAVRRKPMFVESASLIEGDRIPVCAPAADLPNEPKYSDAFVELVAWAWTEGSRNFRLEKYDNITQSDRVNAPYVARIRAALTALVGPAKATLIGNPRGLPAWAEYGGRNERQIREFSLSLALGRLIWAAAPGGTVSCDFVLSLTAAQLRLFVDTSVAADGSIKRSVVRGNQYESATMYQKDPRRLDPFEMACALLGIATSRTRQGDGWLVHLKSRAYTAPLRKGQRVAAEQVEHDGIVWCPTTANGTWLARRRGTVYFTGNSNRIPETLGRGGFLLHPHVEGVEDVYVDGEHIVYYKPGDTRALRTLIDRWLQDPEGRDKIRHAGMLRVMESETFEVRMGEVLADLGMASRQAVG